jgi:hypothetical protein
MCTTISTPLRQVAVNPSNGLPRHEIPRNILSIYFISFLFHRFQKVNNERAIIFAADRLSHLFAELENEFPAGKSIIKQPWYPMIKEVPDEILESRPEVNCHIIFLAYM